MNRISICACAVLAALLVACNAPRQTEQINLYQALGGEEGIDKLVDDILFGMLSNPKLRDSFGELSLADYPRFKYNFAQQLCELAGGPCRYTGPDMRAAHKGLKVTRRTVRRERPRHRTGNARQRRAAAHGLLPHRAH